MSDQFNFSFDVAAGLADGESHWLWMEHGLTFTYTGQMEGEIKKRLSTPWKAMSGVIMSCFSLRVLSGVVAWSVVAAVLFCAFHQTLV